MISSFADPTNVSPEPCVASSDVLGSNPDDCAAATPHMVSFPFLAHPLTSATPIELQSAADTAPGTDSGSDLAEDCAGAPTPPHVQAASTPSVLDGLPPPPWDLLRLLLPSNIGHRNQMWLRLDLLSLL